MPDQSGSGLVRPEALQLPSVAHGSVAASELADLGLDPARVLDFSVNTNPLGPAPSLLRALQTVDWTRYPGDDEHPLRHALARRAGVEADQVALGNGSAELLWLLGLAVLRRGDRVAVPGPTFGEYARAAGVLAAEVEHVHHPAEAPAVLCVQGAQVSGHCGGSVAGRAPQSGAG
jgi:histidinol-phosphate/aromatic aminotransferase/cobyric acid decarboxylase-like protein